MLGSLHATVEFGLDSLGVLPAPAGRVGEEVEDDGLGVVAAVAGGHILKGEHGTEVRDCGLGDSAARFPVTDTRVGELSDWRLGQAGRSVCHGKGS